MLHENVRAALGDQLERAVAKIEEKLQSARLAGQESPTVESLSRQKTLLLWARTALQRPELPRVELQAVLQSAASEGLPSWEHESARLDRQKKNITHWAEIRQAIGDRSPLFQLELALSSHGTRFGLFGRSHYDPHDQSGKITDFTAAFRGYITDAQNAAQAANQPFNSYFDLNSISSLLTLESFFPTRVAFSSDMAMERGLPASALATVHDVSGLVDTPNDTLDQIDWKNLVAQMEDVRWLLLGSSTRGSRGALVDPQFYGRTDLDDNTGKQTVMLLEQTAGASVPHLAAAEYLIGCEPDSPNDKTGPLAGTRYFSWYLTHVDGSAKFSTLPTYTQRLQAFQMGDDGLPIRMLNQYQADGKGQVQTIALDGKTVRAMVFAGRRVDLFGLFDPRYLDHLDKIQIYDARRMDNAQYSAVYAQDGVAAAFFPENIAWQLLISRGETANRMVILNADRTHPAGRGFTTVDRADIGPLAWQSTLDLRTLDDARQADLEKFGISNEVIQDLRRASKNELDQATTAQRNRDYLDWQGHTYAAWSLEAQAYQQLISTSNGIIQAVIFLLLAIIPFAYFLERLLIGATNIYKQIGGFAAIFALTTAALASFHPAFRLTRQPLMILLAFLIILLSGMVIYILYEKFEEEILLLRGAGASSHRTSLKRGAVIGAAVRLGLSNMRRRGMRTTLTLITLVLLTFTLLCFTSVRDVLQLSPGVVTQVSESKPGILLRQRGWKELPGETISVAAEVAGANGIMAQRYWYASTNPQQAWSLQFQPVRGAADGVTVAGLLGLDATEGQFHALDMAAVLPGWDRFERGEAVCFLPFDETNSLQVDDEVELLGHRLKIAGFFKPADLSRLQALTGDPLLPLDPTGVAFNQNSNDSASRIMWLQYRSRSINF